MGVKGGEETKGRDRVVQVWRRVSHSRDHGTAECKDDKQQ